MDRSHNVSNECARVRSGELAPETGLLALRPRVLNPDPVLTTQAIWTPHFTERSTHRRDEEASGVGNNRERVTLTKATMTTRRRSVALARHGTATRRHKLANEDNESTDEMKLRNGMQDAEKCNDMQMDTGTGTGYCGE